MAKYPQRHFGIERIILILLFANFIIYGILLFLYCKRQQRRRKDLNEARNALFEPVYEVPASRMDSRIDLEAKVQLAEPSPMIRPKSSLDHSTITEELKKPDKKFMKKNHHHHHKDHQRTSKISLQSYYPNHSKTSIYSYQRHHLMSQNSNESCGNSEKEKRMSYVRSFSDMNSRAGGVPVKPRSSWSNPARF